MKSPGPRRRWRTGLLLLAATWLAIAAWNQLKPLPPGTHVAGPMVPTPVASLRMLADITTPGAGTRQLQQQIHAATLQQVRNARDFLVLDYFLFNDQGGPSGPLRYENGLTPTSAELVAALRELKAAQPQLPVLVITDPINDYYRGTVAPALAALRGLGIDVVSTRLDPLRDSNPLYSTTWRLLLGPWWPTDGEGAFGNVLDGAGPGLRAGALARLPNFKANHRKLLITGDGTGGLVGLVSSGNPHDASSAHSNVALEIRGEALRPLLASELEVARFSGWRGAQFEAWLAPREPAGIAAQDGTLAGIATEGAIRDALLQQLEAAGSGDAIDVAMFYLSDRKVIAALKAASRRGASLRLLLDPNRDAFGFRKAGIPNRDVAGELQRAGAVLRWHPTQGEQFHVKFVAVRRAGRLWFTLGSANLTRRNLGDYNLEANAIVDTPASSPLAEQVGRWFESLWAIDSAPLPDPGLPRYGLYRLMEASGLSTF